MGEWGSDGKVRDGYDEASSEGMSSHFSCFDDSGSESGRLCSCPGMGGLDSEEGPCPAMSEHWQSIRAVKTNCMSVTLMLPSDQVPGVRRTRTRAQFHGRLHALPLADRALAEFFCPSALAG